jgi:hypothetical protein
VVAGPDHRGEQRDGQDDEGDGEDVGEIDHAGMVPRDPLAELSGSQTRPKEGRERS